jgi:hypothetical protein
LANPERFSLTFRAGAQSLCKINLRNEYVRLFMRIMAIG